MDGAQNQLTGDTSGPDTEVTLDIEVAGAVAPGASITLKPLLAEPGHRCWSKEGTPFEHCHWCGRQAKIEILNILESERSLILEATLAAGQPTDSTLAIEGLGVSQKLKINGSGTHWMATFKGYAC